MQVLDAVSMTTTAVTSSVPKVNLTEDDVLIFFSS